MGQTSVGACTHQLPSTTTTSMVRIADLQLLGSVTALMSDVVADHKSSLNCSSSSSAPSSSTRPNSTASPWSCSPSPVPNRAGTYQQPTIPAGTSQRLSSPHAAISFLQSKCSSSSYPTLPPQRVHSSLACHEGVVSNLWSFKHLPGRWWEQCR